MNTKNYHELIAGAIFMGGAADVEAMVKNEGVEVVVDLREEAKECAAPDTPVEWQQFPLGDEAHEPQAELLRQAILAVAGAYEEGRKVAFHCGGGKGRTGTVAYGLLLELGLADSLEDAERKAKAIRPVLNIKPAQREALLSLYGK